MLERRARRGRKPKRKPGESGPVTAFDKRLGAHKRVMRKSGLKGITGS